MECDKIKIILRNGDDIHNGGTETRNFNKSTILVSGNHLIISEVVDGKSVGHIFKLSEIINYVCYK
jgi:hypothetical protein